MYEISLNNSTLYHPNSEKSCITNGVLHELLNDSGFMDITVPCTNPLYEQIEERTGKIVLYKDEKDIWYGTVRDINVDFNKNKNLYVVGELSELNDTVQPLHKYTNLTKTQIFTAIVNHHNSMVETEKQFEVGRITKNAQKKMTIVTNWEYSLDAIREHLCDKDEFVKVRRENGHRFVDIVDIESYGKRSEQYVSFGDNLLDYAEDSTSADIASICIPLGATLENEEVEDYENYLTCVTPDHPQNYVENTNAVQRIGRITKVVHFNVLTTPEALITAATNWLEEAQFSKLTLKLSAIDLSILEANVDDYKIGDYIRAVCEPYGMDAWMPVREKETDILNLSNNKITVGAVGNRSITTQQTEMIDDVKRYIPSKTSILDSAKKNASALINGAGTDGHVVLHTNDDGVVYEILIMNTSDIKTATKIWRWNESGFGYSNDGGKTYGLAMTMDGAIVADFITAGDMSADRIHGGTFVAGGMNNENGVIQIKNQYDNVNGQWDNEGILLKVNETEDDGIEQYEQIKFLPADSQAIPVVSEDESQYFQYLKGISFTSKKKNRYGNPEILSSRISAGKNLNLFGDGGINIETNNDKVIELDGGQLWFKSKKPIKVYSYSESKNRWQHNTAIIEKIVSLRNENGGVTDLTFINGILVDVQ